MSGLYGEPDLVLSMGDCETHATCSNCGEHLGTVRPDQPLDTFASAWERHVMTKACDWVEEDDE